MPKGCGHMRMSPKFSCKSHYFLFMKVYMTGNVLDVSVAVSFTQSDYWSKAGQRKPTHTGLNETRPS